jgi:hypothetical protein
MKAASKFPCAVTLLFASLVLTACSGQPRAASPTGGGSGPYTIGGTVTGMTGTGLVLQDNGGDNLTITKAGTFTFATTITSGKAYAVTVLTQPSGPAQTCTVTSGSGTASSNVTSVAVACGAAAASGTVGGTISGLTGTGLILQDNGGDNLTVTANGAFTFKTSVSGTYAVTVLTQPSNPAQTCTVTNGSGTLAANVTNVQVNCGTGTFSIGGTVTGLAGTGLVLQDNGGDNLTITKNGVFTFGTALAVGGAYKVTVLTQPTTPSQVCSVAAGSGNANSNVGTVVVNCSTGTIAIGGSVSGLDGTGLVLQNNGGDNLTITKNGSFTFATLLGSGSPYNVSILTQPSNPSQVCTFSQASGTTASANVTSVQIVCPAVFHKIGGQIVGLIGTNSGMVLQDNGGDNLPINGNGGFTFVTPIAHGSAYDVSVFVGPTTNLGVGCIVWGFQGTATTDINTVVVDCGHNDWTWMDGANTANPLGTNTPPSTTFDTSSPGGRKYSGTWTDNSGNLWLFGGIGWDLTLTANPVFLGDMWEYTGTQNYFGSVSNLWQKVALSGPVPSPRSGAHTWTDGAGTLWLFGGQNAATDFLNDLWSFNTTSKTWTLVSAGGLNQNGTYGTQGTPALGNTPGGRWGATVRFDGSGNLWLFGGFGLDSATSTPGLLNDLWKLNGGQWTWVSGSNLQDQTGVYGTLGTPAAGNVPGARQAPVSWIDASGNFFLFGGYNLSGGGQPNAFNDLWEFSGGQWTWVNGSNLVNQTGVYGTQGTAAASNVPGARWSSAAWIDAAGRLWLFGGQGFDATGNGSLADLWQFSGGQWTWVKGPNAVSQIGIYGLQTTSSDGSVWPHVTNYPGSRYGSAYWTTSNGALWLFGGEGFDSTTTAGGNGLMNDLFRYLPYP